MSESNAVDLIQEAVGGFLGGTRTAADTRLLIFATLGQYLRGINCKELADAIRNLPLEVVEED